MTPSWMRTLRRRARAGTPVRPIGRPRIPEAERQRVAQLVRAQRDEQGQDAGARPIGATLSRTAPGVGRDLVEEALSAQKQADRAAARAATDAQRVSLEVLGRDTVWTADVTHGGRLGDGTAVEGEVIRDRATLATPRAAFGPMPTAADVIAGLEAVAIRQASGWGAVDRVGPATGAAERARSRAGVAIDSPSAAGGWPREAALVPGRVRPKRRFDKHLCDRPIRPFSPLKDPIDGRARQSRIPG